MGILLDTYIVHPSSKPSPITPAASEIKKTFPDFSGPEKRLPDTDQYIPEDAKKQESAGIYWIEKDQDGTPKIHFDQPDLPDKLEKSDRPEQTERCTCNTDKVDREIKRLKEKQEAIQQQIQSETDEIKRLELEKKLAQIESELHQKNNDTYRRQHAEFS